MSDCTAIQAKKSSFRGVEFHYQSGSVSGGRRGATHEYPFREDHYDEDLGKIAPRFSVSGYFQQPNVRDKLRELETAFNVNGHGVFYDAWLNRERIVRVVNFTIDLSRSDLKTGYFSAEFVERGIEPAPSAIRNALAALSAALTNFNEALTTGYSLIYGTVQSVEDTFVGFSLARSYFSTGHRMNFVTSASVLAAKTELEKSNPSQSDIINVVENWVNEVTDIQTIEQQFRFLNNLSAIGIGGSRDVKTQELLFAGIALERYAELVIGADYSGRKNAVSELIAFSKAVTRLRDLALFFELADLAQAASCLGTLAGNRVSLESGDLPIIETARIRNVPALVASFDIFGDIGSAIDIMMCNNSMSGTKLLGDIEYVVTAGN